MLAWVLGMFVVLSLATLKREPYLMPLVPGLALMIGASCQNIWSSDQNPRELQILKLMLTLLAVAFVLALFVGPTLLQRRFNVALSLFPPVFIVAMLVLSSFLIWAVIRSNLHQALAALAALAVGFMVGVVQFALPASDQANSARGISEEIKSLAVISQKPVGLYSPRWPHNEDVVSYLNLQLAIPRIPTEQTLRETVQKTGQISVVTDRSIFLDLKQSEEMGITLIREFRQPKKKSMYLLSVWMKGPGINASAPDNRQDGR